MYDHARADEIGNLFVDVALHFERHSVNLGTRRIVHHRVLEEMKKLAMQRRPVFDQASFDFSADLHQIRGALEKSLFLSEEGESYFYTN